MIYGRQTLDLYLLYLYDIIDCAAKQYGLSAIEASRLLISTLLGPAAAAAMISLRR